MTEIPGSGPPPGDPLRHLLRRSLLAAAGFSLAMNLLQLAPSLYMLQVFDRVLVSRSHETLLVLLGGIVLALAMAFAMDLLRTRLQAVVGSLIGDALSPRVATRLLAALARRPEGASSNAALRDVASVRQAFSGPGLTAVFDAPWLLVYVGVITLANGWLGLAALVSALLMVGLAVINDRLTRRSIETVQQEGARTQRWLEHAMNNAEVAQALGMADVLLSRWSQLNGKVFEHQAATAKRTAVLAAGTRTVRQLIQSMVLSLGAWLVITKQASPGVMIATTILLSRALAPVEQIVGSWRVLAEGRAAWARLRELARHDDAEPERMELPAPRGHLQVQGVTLRAGNSDRLLLSTVGFDLPAGEALAILGPSGAGKSTLLRVLIGLWRPTAGNVRLDGADLADWPRAQVGPAIGYVPQDVELFAGTVAENIARMGPVEPQRVAAAAMRAGVHQLVLSLPRGYDTPVDPQGVAISPGQRQRIALARALYGDPKLLVLDEPNANLDLAGEQALAAAIAALRGQVTIVVVTHRVGLLRHMDRMLVLERGQVQHSGSVAEVQARMQQLLKPASTQDQVVPIQRAGGARPAGGAA